MRPLVVLLVVLAMSSMSSARAEVHDGGVARTARAVRAAVKAHRLDGHVWLGKLRGVGGGRDTLLHVPQGLDATRAIELVIYMEGIDSFSDKSIRRRHIASIARLGANVIYVAPDAPSSHHGNREAVTEHWQAGCADELCPGGHAAPGDFVVFLDEVRTQIGKLTGRDRSALDLRVSLIGFSRGGKGVLAALEQLETVGFTVGGHAVKLADVIFADGNYLDDALDGSWRILEKRPEAPRLTILVGAGEFPTVGGDGNRRRALAFWRTVAPSAPLPAADRAVSAPRLRLVPLAGGHDAIGNAAVDFLASRPSNTRQHASRTS